MRENQHNSQSTQKDKYLSAQNVSGTYIAPDIEIIEIETQMNIMAGSGGVPELPGEEM